MASGHEERDEGKARRVAVEERGEQMALEMVHADRRDAEPESKAVRERRADEERAREPRTLREGDRIQLALRGAGSMQHRAHEGKYAPDVVSRRELGHHAAVLIVQRHLRVQRMRQQAAIAVVDGYAGFVTGSLDAQHQHDFYGVLLISVSPLSATSK